MEIGDSAFFDMADLISVEVPVVLWPSSKVTSFNDEHPLNGPSGNEQISIILKIKMLITIFIIKRSVY